MLLPMLLLACVVYAIIAGAATKHELKTWKSNGGVANPVVKFIFAAGIPVLTAGVMTILFLVEGVSTTVQFNVGSSSRMNAWSTWVGLWPLFLVLTSANGLGTFVWIIACAVKKNRRSALGAAVFACCLSVLAFCTVASYFPTA